VSPARATPDRAGMISAACRAPPRATPSLRPPLPPSSTPSTAGSLADAGASLKRTGLFSEFLPTAVGDPYKGGGPERELLNSSRHKGKQVAVPQGTPSHMMLGNKPVPSIHVGDKFIDQARGKGREFVTLPLRSLALLPNTARPHRPPTSVPPPPPDDHDSGLWRSARRAGRARPPMAPPPSSPPRYPKRGTFPGHYKARQARSILTPTLPSRGVPRASRGGARTPPPTVLKGRRTYTSTRPSGADMDTARPTAPSVVHWPPPTPSSVSRLAGTGTSTSRASP